MVCVTFNFGQTEIEELVQNPAQIRKIDARTGQPLKDLRTGESATAYLRADGHGVIQNDATGEVFHVSNRNDPNWQFYWEWP